MEKWETPKIIHENVLKPHYTFFNEQEISLNGKWKFKCSDSPETRPVNFYQSNFDDSKWDEIDVPCCWETRGYGQPYYFGSGYPPAICTEEDKIPMIKHELNFVGSYRNTFFIPKEWIGEKIVLCFGSAKSALVCWVNGQYAGMAKGSMLPSEFDITDIVKDGKNTVCAEVYQYSDATYIEDQDMWFLSGLYRDVKVYAQPKENIYDIYAYAELDSEYKNAELKVEVTTENASGKKLSAELCDGVLSLVSNEQKVIGNKTVFTFFCENVKKWTGETPNLYQIKVILKNDDQEIQIRSIDFGFRKIEIKDARLLINGMPLKLRGVNYHCFTTDNGYYMPREAYEKDLRTMKLFNINAVRTSHYPHDDYFYELCNKYGIYVMDECNVESHGVRDKNVPGNNPLWTAHVVDRMCRMVTRDRNHPCVVIWSLGNESNAGTNHYKMKEAALELDQTRKIHYEGGADLKLSDFLCVGYSSWERDKMFAEGMDVPEKVSIVNMDPYLEMSLDKIRFKDYKDHAIVSTEYNHSMGNSGCELEKHTEIYEESSRWCGGFIWDFKDKSILKGEMNGKPFHAVGGDFGENSHPGVIGCNGITNWEGDPHHTIYDIKKAFQTMAFERLEDGSVRLKNRNSFINIKDYQCIWRLSHDSELIEAGEVSVEVEPGQVGILGVPYQNPMTEPGEYFYTVSFQLKEDTLWAKAGYEIAYEQWLVKTVVITEVWADAETEGRIDVVENTSSITVTAGEVIYTINKHTGNIDQISKYGKDFLKTPLRPSFFRAKTDSDVGFMGLAFKKYKDLGYWGNSSLGIVEEPCTIEIRQSEVIDITVRQRIKGDYMRVYTIFADGKLKVRCEFTTQEEDVPERIGMQVELGKAYDIFTWFGKGPHDTYPGREFSGIVDVFQKLVTEQDEHVRPQEHGNKQGVRWMTLMDQFGQGVKIEAYGHPIAASAWPYTLADLQKAERTYELPDFMTTTLNIDCIQNGLGDSFVKCPERLKIQPSTKYIYEFFFTVQL